jgi:hypothetical protein
VEDEARRSLAERAGGRKALLSSMHRSVYQDMSNSKTGQFEQPMAEIQHKVLVLSEWTLWKEFGVVGLGTTKEKRHKRRSDEFMPYPGLVNSVCICARCGEPPAWEVRGEWMEAIAT